MKILCLAVASFLGCTAFAQEAEPFSIYRKQLYLKTDTVPAGKMPNVFSRPVIKFPQKPREKPRVTGTSGYGTVYALPLDNMPCLVPNMKAMPPMPNPGNSQQEKSIDPGIYLTPPQPLMPDQNL